MALILANESTAAGPTGPDEAIVIDATLTVADTSEVLFTIPAGHKLRSFSLVNVSNPNTDAHVSLAAGVAATTGDIRLGRRDSLNEDGLDLAEGTYAYIGGAGDTPTLRGIVWFGPA